MNESDAPPAGVNANAQPQQHDDELRSAMLASEERHRVISELIADYAYAMRVEPDGSMVREWYAGNFSAISGYSNDELAGLDFWMKLVHPEDWHIVGARLNAFGEGRASVDEYRIITSNGEVRWLRDYGQPMRDASGAVLRIYGAAQDITEQKEAEDRLRRSEEEYQSIFELAGSAKAQANPETGRLLRVNQRFCDMLGYTREELLDKSFFELTHPDDHAIDEETYRLLILGNETHRSFDKRYLHRNGSIVWAHLELTLVRDAKRRPLHYVASIQDITARRQNEARVRFQAKLLNAVQQAVIATDAAGRITFWNRHAEALYGWPTDEAIGRSVVEVLATPEQTQSADEIMATVARGEMWHGEFEIQRRDGSRFFAEVTDSPVFDESGNVVGIIGISQDITERRRLQQNERMLADVGQLLVESLSTEERVNRLANLLAQRFAEICTILLVDEAGTPIHFKAVHRDPAKEPLLMAISQYVPMQNPVTATSRALRTGRPVFFPIVPDDYKQATAVDARHSELREALGFHSMITLPLIARGNTLGVMTIARSAELPEYHPQDFTFMMEISRSAALFLDNTRLYERTHAMNAELEQRVQARTAELRESQSQLRLLTARLQSTREDERRRIAREVHDVIGQLLTSLKMEAGRLDVKLNEAGSPLNEHTHSMIAMLDSAFRSVRQIATDLRPTLLDDLGLIAAMEWQVEDFQTRSGIACRFDSTLDSAPLNNDASIAVFRVLQEALTNVARHAGATRVNVTVEEDHRGWLVLRIHDDGRGISMSDLQQTQSLGLVGMRERVHLLGGEWKISGEPSKGTLLTICVPMNSAADGQATTD